MEVVAEDSPAGHVFVVRMSEQQLRFIVEVARELCVGVHGFEFGPRLGLTRQAATALANEIHNKAAGAGLVL